jgi:hypothetical protein
MTRRRPSQRGLQGAAWCTSAGQPLVPQVPFRRITTMMIKQLEEKVFNLLHPMTSAISQAGNNQVRVIGSTAEREAAVEFARAAAKRPQIVGASLQQIASDPEVLEVLFDILEVQRIAASSGRLTLVPKGTDLDLLKTLKAAEASE